MSTATESPTTVPPQLATAIEQMGIKPLEVPELIATFGPFFQQAQELIAEAQEINVSDPEDREGIKKAAASRKALKTVRCAAENKRKERKAGLLAETKAIDKVHGVVEAMIVPVEARMEAMETIRERLEAERIERLKVQRAEALRPYGVDTAYIDLGKMSDAQWTKLLEDSVAAYEARIEREKKAAEDRARQEADAKAERERQAEESRINRERAEAERQAREAVERTARLEREEREAEVRREREEADRKIREAKAAQERAERELREKQEAERKESERLAAERRRAEAAPDAVKIQALAVLVASIEMPSVETEGGRAFLAWFSDARDRFAAAIEAKAARLMEG